jgi:hypothetical protein
MFVAKVGDPSSHHPDDDPDPSKQQAENDNLGGRVRNVVQQLKKAEEVLVRELGPDWREKVSKLAKIDKLQLAKKLLEAGASAGAITGLLRLRGSDLKLIKTGLVGDDTSRSGKVADESVKPREMEDNEDRPEEVDVGKDRSRKVADTNVKPGKVEADEDLQQLKEQIIEQVLAEADAKGAEKAAQVDRDYQMKLRMKAMQSTKPVEAREIMDMAFHHNLEQALGRYAAHLISQYGLVKPDKKAILDDDWRKAFMAYSEVLDNLVKVHEDAKVLERLKAENVALEAWSSHLEELLLNAFGYINKYYRVFELYTKEIPQLLCEGCRKRVMARLVVYSGGGGA